MFYHLCSVDTMVDVSRERGDEEKDEEEVEEEEEEEEEEESGSRISVA